MGLRIRGMSLVPATNLHLLRKELMMRRMFPTAQRGRSGLRNQFLTD